MKTAKLLATALMSLASLPLLALQTTVSGQESTKVNAGGNSVNSSAGASAHVQGGGVEMNGAGNGSASAAEEMRPVNGELVGKLDSKTAHEGDQVVLKTTQKTQTVDGTVIPKGSRLVGHVTSVQAHGKGSADSQMGIQFDHAELKDGHSLPIHSEIRSVSPSASAMAASQMASDDGFSGGGMAGSAGLAGGGRAMGAANAGGGLLGGASGTVRSTAGVVGQAGSGLGAIATDTTSATGRIASEGLGGRGSLACSAGGALGAHATGIHGVMLGADATGRTSGMLSASRQNVHLESGTQMVLGVAPAR